MEEEITMLLNIDIMKVKIIFPMKAETRCFIYTMEANQLHRKHL